ncbi:MULTISPECIES: hypothetical protein [unclassified Vibrio]|uniref:hypothetical protein n=1 Tax=unclassified Vibrio TaxID=2614977 RepID=UPI00355220CD
MNFLTSKKLVQIFTEIAGEKMCHGAKEAPKLLLQAFESMEGGIDDSTMQYIYNRFCIKLNDKPSWGYKQLATMLSGILEERMNVG